MYKIFLLVQLSRGRVHQCIVGISHNGEKLCIEYIKTIHATLGACSTWYEMWQQSQMSTLPERCSLRENQWALCRRGRRRRARGLMMDTFFVADFGMADNV